MITGQKLIVVASLLMHCNVSVAQYDERPDMFFVAPVTTELQRAEVSSVDVYAVVNCDVLPDDDAKLASLKMERFSSKLKEHVTDDATLKMVCRFEFQQDGERDRDARDRIKKKLIAIAKAAGFKNVQPSVTQTSGKWSEALFDASAVPEEVRDSEPAVDMGLVIAYPIRTTLSKFVVGDFDCVVVIKQPIDGREQEMSAELVDAIKASVNALKLKEKRRLKFDLTSTTAGRELIETQFAPRLPPKRPATDSPLILQMFNEQFAAYKASPALDLVLDLGFESMQFTHSPRGGEPEKMIGKTAPNFRLTRISGEKLDLREFIKGRPAIVSFWDLGSESYQQESPHLARLSELYGDELAIVGVNRSSNSREDVVKFVREKGLAYPIALHGKDVSRHSYLVGAYPATFWIDGNGMIVDFHLAFTTPDDLEQRAKQLVESK